jgi:hypothetical protein
MLRADNAPTLTCINCSPIAVDSVKLFAAIRTCLIGFQLVHLMLLSVTIQLSQLVMP